MDKDYKVGYARPPKEHQFKKGQSGNPSGSRKSSGFDKLEIITAVYSEKIAITINGKRKKVSSFEAALRMTLHTAITKGDFKAFERVLELVRDQGGDWRERWAAEARAGADEVMQKIARTVDALIPLPEHDPVKSADCDRREEEELCRILACSNCGEHFREQWDQEDDDEAYWTSLRKAIAARDRKVHERGG